MGNIKRSRGPPPCIRWCVVDAYDDLGEKWGTLSGARDPLLVSDGVLWPSYDDLGEKWGTFSRAQDLLLVSDGVLWPSYDDLGEKWGTFS